MKDFSAVEMGKRIKETRSATGMSQALLGTKIGVAQNTISQYEKGTATPSVEVIARLAQALETTSDYLIGLSDY